VTLADDERARLREVACRVGPCNGSVTWFASDGRAIGACPHSEECDAIAAALERAVSDERARCERVARDRATLWALSTRGDSVCRALAAEARSIADAIARGT